MPEHVDFLCDASPAAPQESLLGFTESQAGCGRYHDDLWTVGDPGGAFEDVFRGFTRVRGKKLICFIQYHCLHHAQAQGGGQECSECLWGANGDMGGIPVKGIEADLGDLTHKTTDHDLRSASRTRGCTCGSLGFLVRAASELLQDVCNLLGQLPSRHDDECSACSHGGRLDTGYERDGVR